MSQEWDIKPRGSACRSCEKVFTDQEPCWSVLLFGEEGYSRADYCAPCWDAGKAAGTIVSKWQGLFVAPAAKVDPGVQKETAESLLRKLIEQENPDRGPAIFILAVMLERSKTLVERDVKPCEDGSLLRIYEHRRTGETFLITDPRLRLNELEAVQDEVSVLLGAKPRGEQAPEPAPEEAVEPAAEAE